MTFLYENFWLESGSRLTGTWLWPWRGSEEGQDLVVLISKVTLGINQDGSMECDFLSSHVPWAFGGIHGVGPSGDPWLMLAQIAPASLSLVVNSENDWWAMVDGLIRALTYNNEAEVSQDVGLTKADLHDAYKDSGISVDRIADWSVTELVSGPLAEATNMALTQIVDGRTRQCAFPDTTHECQHDVFRDVFAGWTTGLIPVPDFYPEVDE